MDIQFTDLCYYLPVKKGKDRETILKSLNGEFRSGQLNAIMGPSGAGKSTLMNVIAGFKTSNVGGTISVNHQVRDVKKFRKKSCYIMQRDDLCPVLSVMELMNFATDLKVGDFLCSKKKKQLVDEILETMWLSHTVSTRTVNLSGGEKKRLAIALELISNPPVMFFDEPTTGLDSSTCFQCVSILKSLAQEGRTIICVIHQPSSSVFEMFDQLYLLAKGQCIYQGPTTDVISLISNSIGINCPTYHSPADFAIDVAVGKYGNCIDKLVDDVKTSSRHSSVQEAVGVNNGGNAYTLLPLDFRNKSNEYSDQRDLNRSTTSISGWKQFSVIFKKTFICNLRDWTYTRVRFGIQLVIGILSGLMYFNTGNEASQSLNIIGNVIYAQLVYACLGWLITTMTFPLERSVLVREHLNNWYKLKYYYLAKTMADLPLEIAFTTIYVIILYFLSNHPCDVTRFFKFLTIGILASLVSQSMGLALGAGLSLKNAVFMAPPTIVPFYLFAGCGIKLNEIPNYLNWLSYASFMRYGYEGSMLSIFGFDRPPLDCTHEYCYFKSPFKILKWVAMDDSEYWIDVTVLLIYFIVVRFLTFFILRWKLNSKF